MNPAMQNLARRARRAACRRSRSAHRGRRRRPGRCSRRRSRSAEVVIGGTSIWPARRLSTATKVSSVAKGYPSCHDSPVPRRWGTRRTTPATVGLTGPIRSVYRLQSCPSAGVSREAPAQLSGQKVTTDESDPLSLRAGRQ